MVDRPVPGKNQAIIPILRPDFQWAMPGFDARVLLHYTHTQSYCLLQIKRITTSPQTACIVHGDDRQSLLRVIHLQGVVLSEVQTFGH